MEAVILARSRTMRLGHSGTLVPRNLNWKDVHVRDAFGVERVR